MAMQETWSSQYLVWQMLNPLCSVSTLWDSQIWLYSSY